MFPKYVKAEYLPKSGRNNRTLYKGFKTEQEMQECIDAYLKNWYVYFPRASSKKQDEDGTWSFILQEADSCD